VFDIGDGDPGDKCNCLNQTYDQCGECNGGNTTGCLNNDCDTYCDCDGNELEDCAGVCGGGAFVDEGGECVSCLVGDVNGSGGWNVLDIVSVVSCVLADNCGSAADGGCSADVNGDGGWNVQDIIILVNCVLANNCGG
jgi:hypothetical protein